MTRALFLALLLSVPLQDDLAKKIEEIIPRLADDSIDVRNRAVQELADLGPTAVPLLKKRAAELGAETSGRLLEAVGRIESRNTLGKYLPPLKKITLDWENKPVREALDEISRRSGIGIDASGAGLDGAVAFSLKDAGPIEAFDEVCRRAGLSWRPANDDFFGRRRGNVPRDQPRIMIQNGKAIDYPSTYIRHYRIRVTQVSLTRTNTFQASQSNAQLNLDLAWTPDVKPDGLHAFKVTEMKDEQGRSMLQEDNDRFRGRMRMGRSRYRSRDMGNASQYLAFKYPEKDATKIALLKGTASFSFPQEVKTLTIEKPAEAAGKAIELNGLTITLKDYQEKAQSRSLTLEITGRFNGPKDDPADEDDGFNMPFSYEDVELVSEAGEALRNQGMSGRGDGRTYTWTLDYEGAKGEKGSAPKEIRIFCVLRRFIDETAFEIKDIALPK